MSVASHDEGSFSRPSHEDEIRRSVFGGSELESDSCAPTCCDNSRPTLSSRIDPARFYEEDEGGSTTAPFTPSFALAECTLPTHLGDIYRDRRRQTRVQSLEDIVLLFAIPLRKQDGSLNKQWAQCEVQPVGPQAGEPRHVNYRFDDPINGDRVFAFICPISGGKRCVHLDFVMRSPTDDDIDAPNGGCYTLPLNSPGIFSLRDGILATGDRIHDMGIVIYYKSRENTVAVADDVPILHYFDEVTGGWGWKRFGQSSDGRWAYQAVLTGCRRTRFVVNVSTGSWVRGTDGRDFHVAWPGAYWLSEWGELRHMEGRGLTT